ncbi:hypothetical protein AB0H71_04000 [Nocardia sp. NPDC050697]|uniref:hypothetical protein n=1 Tax=Nocardia sp. NPDC050697 TaxID=3155158 RepID=UPI0033FE2995
MADRLEVDPAKLRHAAELTRELSTDTKAVADRLRAALGAIESDAEPMPWGNDKRGHKFFDGEKGYKAARDNMIEGCFGAAKSLGDMATGQSEAADALEGTEFGTTGQFGGAP